MRLCFATNNENKLNEIRDLLPDFEILSLSDIDHDGELPEEQATLEGNSHQKAAYIYDRYKLSCFADDTGLEVEALNGEPGVHSARYAGNHDSEANMNLLLRKLENSDRREARFRTIITLIQDGETKQFEGIVKGEITQKRRGKGGFGYDPIFKPEGHRYTFGEMTNQQKNEISHRGEAVKKLVEYLMNSVKRK